MHSQYLLEAVQKMYAMLAHTRYIAASREWVKFDLNFDFCSGSCKQGMGEICTYTSSFAVAKVIKWPSSTCFPDEEEELVQGII